MEPIHWTGLGALIMTVGANLVLITVFAQKIRTDIAVVTTRLDMFDADLQGVTTLATRLSDIGTRVAREEERGKYNAQIIMTMQQENLRLWQALEDLRRGKGFIRNGDS